LSLGRLGSRDRQPDSGARRCISGVTHTSAGSSAERGLKELSLEEGRDGTMSDLRKRVETLGDCWARDMIHMLLDVVEAVETDEPTLDAVVACFREAEDELCK